ncbi:urea carboxylase [Pseudomethylobacillus aquaticus]|uniref:Urea carboxylase n=1 Tax=Pseudomethylobacillus aquaticus TaxID=2676064 RepID=A0A3N0V7N4_9PROT|nr:urea carboxylase [Pseudomethylobacillus aquaticus]ROH88388.1 urea carboxylase [Pseudomethylobacillus aquaticus]
MFEKVLIANRGEIACRVIRTLNKMGIRAVAVYSEADAGARHVLQADEAICIGPAPAAESYLNIPAILAAAQASGAQAIHPGYGFLSENPGFAEACEAAGLVFIGPTPQQMRDFGLKHTARALAEAQGVPLLPGSKLLADVHEAAHEAARIGYPVMLKSTAGGGGIGMRLIWNADELAEAYASVSRLANANFKQGGLYLEKYVQAARHIEVQIFGDGQGHVVALGERDCSVQRRNQKVIEETPAPHISDDLRRALSQTAISLGRAIGYRSAGTVEFVFDKHTEAFYFLEVNTRLQVEHGVTELVSGVDLVEWMVRCAAGETGFLRAYRHQPKGHAIQVRVYAEDPNKQFQPASGVLTEVAFPAQARVDSWVERGSEVSPFYDPLLAKVLVHAPDRAAAVAELRSALQHTRLSGIATNLAYLRQILADSVFPAGEQTTRYLNSFAYQPCTLDVLDGGVMSTIQDYPGRVGYWNVGVPPSGPMDHLAFRLANRLVGNAEGEAGLEITLIGPTLKFNTEVVIAVTGPELSVTLDDAPLAMWQAHRVAAGSTLKLGKLRDAGCRAYLAIQGGVDVPDYLGSKSTFTLGQFGGHAGRALRTGDVLPLLPQTGAVAHAEPLSPSCRPAYGHHWQIGVLYGPHGAPDFFTDDDIRMFFSTDWEVHYNSNTTGIRLIGPKPQWARRDGGEAGLHPSNIHDNAYAIGAIDFTGDMPVILGPDGPSLGGFVCPATIVQAELWKMGQLKAGDTVRFVRLSQAEARELQLAQNAMLASLQAPQPTTVSALEALLAARQPDTGQRLSGAEASPILAAFPQTAERVAVVYRQAGDQYLLVEYGPLVLDIELRFRVHGLMQALQQAAVPGIIDLTPGIRSLQVHYDSLTLPVEQLLHTLQALEATLPAVEDMEVPTRIVHLPLSWDDAATQLAIEKYMQSVRKDAPWCDVASGHASNIEFIRRINGLPSVDDVKRIVFEASYLTLGLGDVYLGAPVATPMDPRHRLVTTKYNPARTWTPENAVGIGGAYMCVYGMEGPGGYQFVGRTLQMWNRWRETADFRDGKPWLLRFFDQIRFYPVSAAELLQIRADFPHGKFKLRIEEQTLRLRDYQAFLLDEADSIAAFKATQQAAFEAEREHWIATGQAHYQQEQDTAGVTDAVHVLGDQQRAAHAHISGNVWQVNVQPGDQVREGDAVVIVESMKMEISVLAPCTGTVSQVLCQAGGQVAAGQSLLIIDEELAA